MSWTPKNEDDAIPNPDCTDETCPVDSLQVLRQDLLVELRGPKGHHRGRAKSLNYFTVMRDQVVQQADRIEKIEKSLRSLTEDHKRYAMHREEVPLLLERIKHLEGAVQELNRKVQADRLVLAKLQQQPSVIPPQAENIPETLPFIHENPQAIDPLVLAIGQLCCGLVYSLRGKDAALVAACEELERQLETLEAA